jgi:hypothetical protein
MTRVIALSPFEIILLLGILTALAISVLTP